MCFCGRGGVSVMPGVLLALFSPSLPRQTTPTASCLVGMETCCPPPFRFTGVGVVRLESDLLLYWGYDELLTQKNTEQTLKIGVCGWVLSCPHTYKHNCNSVLFLCSVCL